MVSFVLSTFLLSSALFSAFASGDVSGPFTTHFQNWLQSNGYTSDDFVRSDYGTQGSYGGKMSDDDKITNIPVVFIHGNSDSALKTSFTASGWGNTIDYFLKKGYSTAELYATSWQDNAAMNAATRTHNCKDLTRLRRFLQAVLKYTGANQISVISHSMGVTLGRKAIKGGTIDADDGKCDLGSPMGRQIDTFLGLSGANYGLCSCEGTTSVLEPTCNDANGLWPGDSCGFNVLTCGAPVQAFPCDSPTYSQFLMDMNADKSKEATYVYSAWSYRKYLDIDHYLAVDDLILYGDLVWGQKTSLIPNSDGHKQYNTYTHMETKELTYEDQYSFVALHKVPSDLSASH